MRRPAGRGRGGAARAGDGAGASATSATQGAHWRRRLAYAVMIGYAVLMFTPFAWSVITSFKTQADAVQPHRHPAADHDSMAGSTSSSGSTRRSSGCSLNSFGIALAITLSNLVLASLAGYAFARLRFPGREILFLVVLATLMIPDQLRLVPVYPDLNAIGLTRGLGEYLAVVLVMAVMGANIFLMRQYFLSIPRDIEEAARIDGAGFFTTFWRVMLPLATPALSAVAILQFQGAWNAFFWPLILLRDQDYFTVPIALTFFRTAANSRRTTRR